MYDPADRITAKEALKHAWFKEGATPDDGTEAAKIKLQRLQAAQDLARLQAAEELKEARQNGHRS